MSFESRDEPVLSKRAWREFVTAHPLLRFCESGPSFTNPNTGQVISMGFHELDAEVNVDGSWHYAFRWVNGEIRCNERSIRDSDSPIRQIVIDLANELNADLICDEGEIVDLNEL